MWLYDSKYRRFFSTKVKSTAMKADDLTHSALAVEFPREKGDQRCLVLMAFAV